MKKAAKKPQTVEEKQKAKLKKLTAEVKELRREKELLIKEIKHLRRFEGKPVDGCVHCGYSREEHVKLSGEGCGHYRGSAVGSVTYSNELEVSKW